MLADQMTVLEVSLDKVCGDKMSEGERFVDETECLYTGCL